MCIAVPGQLIEVDGSKGKVNVRGNLLSVELSLVEAQVGDYLLIHAGCAIAVVSEDDAAELANLLELVENDGNDD